MGSPYDIFGVVSGIIGILALVLAFLQSQSPSRKMKYLDEVLHDAESLWHKAMEEGLFARTPLYVLHTESQLTMARSQTELLRAQTYCARTFCQLFMATVRGLSSKISSRSKHVEEIRARIATTSAQVRIRLHLEGNLPSPQDIAEFLGSAAEPIRGDNQVISSPDKIPTSNVPTHEQHTKLARLRIPSLWSSSGKAGDSDITLVSSAVSQGERIVAEASLSDGSSADSNAENHSEGGPVHGYSSQNACITTSPEKLQPSPPGPRGTTYKTVCRVVKKLSPGRRARVDVLSIWANVIEPWVAVDEATEDMYTSGGQVKEVTVNSEV
ncbi:hypothetical protein BKA93DRAFT_828582 [Sparassis latifolia]